MQSDDELSFQILQEKIDEAFPDRDPPPRKAEHYGLYAALAGIVVGILGILISPHASVGKLLALLGLATEVVGGAIYTGLGLARTIQSAKFDDRSGSTEFEQDFKGYQSVVSWLRTFSEQQLKTRLIFVSNRIAAWQHGTMLVLGGVEKLGLVSLFVALYLQFKDTAWTWPPEITLAGSLLAFVVISLYALGMWAITRKAQAIRFERYLKLALDSDFKVSKLPSASAPEESM